MTHPEITVGDYLVCKESKGNVYGSTTDLEIVKVTRRTDSTSLMVEIILTVDPSNYKKEVIGEKFGIHRRNFDIVRKFSDLPENIRKGLSSGKFTGNVPKQFIPGFAEISSTTHVDKLGTGVKIGNFILGQSGSLYKVIELLPDGKCKVEFFLDKVVQETFTLSNFTVCSKWDPTYALGDEVLLRNDTTKKIVTKVVVYQKGTSSECIKYLVMCTATRKTYYARATELSKFSYKKSEMFPDFSNGYGYKKDADSSIKRSMASCKKKLHGKKTPVADRVDERLFKKGFYAVIAALKSDLVGEIIYLGKDSNFKALPQDLMSLNGKIIAKDTVSYTPISQVPYSLGPILLDDYLVDSEQICTVDRIKYDKSTSVIVITSTVKGVASTLSLESFNEFVANAKAAANKTKLNTEKQGKKVMKTSAKVPAMQKMMDKMFKKVDNVVLDMATGGVGIRRGDSIYSLSMEMVEETPEYCVGENMFEQLSFDIPAFAQATPLANVKAGDLVLNASGAPHGWAIKINEKSMKVLKMDGSVTNVVPSKVLMMGSGQTVMVVSSLASGQMNNMLPMLMLMEEKGSDGSSLEKILPFMMMQGMGGASAEGNPMGNMMSNPMMMMMMLKDDDSEGMFSDPMMMMAMSGMFGGAPASGEQAANPMGGMMANPLMMMMMLKK